MDSNIDDDVPMQLAKYAATHYLPYALLALALMALALMARQQHLARPATRREGALL